MVIIPNQAFLDENKILYKFQSGFRRNFSTDSCLSYLSNKIANGFESGLHTGMILIDLQKAFDTIDQEILINKLEVLGFSKNVILWFKSYLSNRKFKVNLNKTFSEPGKLLCGVPQGSILGPLLFLLYINDMPQAVKCELLLYADDTCLIFQHNDIKEIEIQLNKNFSLICNWFVDNKLSIHFGEDKTVSYYLKILSNFGYYTKSLLPFTFFIIFGMYLKKRVRLGLHVKCHKKEKLCRCFFSVLLEITNPYSQLQHIFYKVSSFPYNFLNFCFFIFENLLDIIILLDFSLSMISGLFKYLSLLFFPSLTYLFFIITVTFNNSFYNNFGNNFTLLNNYFEKFNESLCLTNNVFLFGQKEIISVSTNPSNTVTSYYRLLFYFMVAIFSSIFYQMNNFKITRQILPFLIFFFLCFNGNPPRESKKYDLKCFPNSEFFRIEVIKITSDISSAEMHMNYCHLH